MAPAVEIKSEKRRKQCRRQSCSRLHTLFELKLLSTHGQKTLLITQSVPRGAHWVSFYMLLLVPAPGSQQWVQWAHFELLFSSWQLL